MLLNPEDKIVKQMIRIEYRYSDLMLNLSLNKKKIEISGNRNNILNIGSQMISKIALTKAKRYILTVCPKYQKPDTSKLSTKTILLFRDALYTFKLSAIL